MSAWEEEFEQIAQEAIERARTVDCTREQFLEGLGVIAQEVQRVHLEEEEGEEEDDEDGVTEEL